MKRRSNTHETEAAKKKKMVEHRHIKQELAEEQQQRKMQNAFVPAAGNAILPQQHGVMTPQNMVAPQQPAFPASPQDVMHHHHERYLYFCMRSQHLAQWWNMVQTTYRQELQFLQNHLEYHGQTWYQMTQLLGGAAYTPPTGHPTWFQP